MQGLIAELQYPSQKRTENNNGGIQVAQNARITYIVKNGNQHRMNPPTIIPITENTHYNSLLSNIYFLVVTPYKNNI